MADLHAADGRQCCSKMLFVSILSYAQDPPPFDLAMIRSKQSSVFRLGEAVRVTGEP